MLAAAPRPCKRGRFRVAISDTPFEPLCDSIRTCVAASRLLCSTRSYSIYRPILRYYDGTSGRGMDRVPVRLCSTECGCVYMCVYVGGGRQFAMVPNRCRKGCARGGVGAAVASSASAYHGALPPLPLPPPASPPTGEPRDLAVDVALKGIEAWLLVDNSDGVTFIVPARRRIIPRSSSRSSMPSRGCCPPFPRNRPWPVRSSGGACPGEDRGGNLGFGGPAARPRC